MGAVALMVGGYLLGALPFGVALAVAHDIDPSESTRLNSTLWREVGKLEAVTVILVDFAKGVFPVLVGFGFSLSVGVVALSGVAAVAGQVWPPLRGHGGKGNVTGMGVVVTLLSLHGANLPMFSLIFFILGIGAVILMVFLQGGGMNGVGHPLSLVFPLGMLLGFTAAVVLSFLSGQPVGLSLGLALVLCVIVVRRLTAGLMVDLTVGVRMHVVLLRRLFFDLPLTGQD
ncbi:MAG: glycerol-3-phosphate acyltransferase [Dehalococcoidia bacterium]|nr:glycerol-3-phosphate acyltransferase [Dehalococcoidia bacterium]